VKSKEKRKKKGNFFVPFVFSSFNFVSFHNKKMQYNLRNPAVRRLMKEAKELIDDLSDDFTAAPMEDNLFEWHFTVRGPSDTSFAGGEYHGRIILPPEYPMKPPSIILLTVRLEKGHVERGKAQRKKALKEWLFLKHTLKNLC